MDTAAMSRREALEAHRGDESRTIQPRRFSIVLRKPLAARNDGANPKSAFKSSKLMGGGEDARRASVAQTPKGVTFLAPDAPDTPVNRRVTMAVTHRRARMRTRKGTGRSVAARTFSLVLREPKEPETEQPPEPNTMQTDSGTSSDKAASWSSKDNASGVSGNSAGQDGSASVGDDNDQATVEIDGVAGHVGRNVSKQSSEPPLFNATQNDPSGVTQNDPENDSEHDDFGGRFDGYDDDDFGGGFDGGEDDDMGGFGATPAHGNVGFGNAMVDGGNDPMTGGLEWGGKRKRPARLGPRRPAGTPHKMERARMAKRQSLALAGAGSRHDLEDEDGRSVRRSARTRTRPLQYWRGETKIYNRVHESLPTVAQMTHRTPNPAWPKNTPWHGGGAVIAVGQQVPYNSAEQGKAAGEEARRRALRLADVAHLSDSEDDLTEELPGLGGAVGSEPALDPFGFSK